MLVFPVGVEHTLNVAVQRPQHLDPGNHAFLEEMRNYHRDEDFKIVKQRDDLVSALRYGIMMRRGGEPPGRRLWQHALRQLSCRPQPGFRQQISLTRNLGHAS